MEGGGVVVGRDGGGDVVVIDVVNGGFFTRLYHWDWCGLIILDS